MKVDLYDPMENPVDDFVTINLSRLRADGTSAEMYTGRDLSVPIGQYRIEAYVGENLHSSFTVYLHQPEVRIRLGVSLANCCMNIPGRSYLGSIIVDLLAEGDPHEYEIQLLPVWHNNLAIGTVVGNDWKAVLAPIDLGDYVVAVMKDEAVVAVRHVQVSDRAEKATVTISLMEHEP